MAQLIKKVKGLGELRMLAKTDERYAKLAIVGASNLGMPADTLEVALRSLYDAAAETDEDGVLDEVNFCRDLV